MHRSLRSLTIGVAATSLCVAGVALAGGRDMPFSFFNPGVFFAPPPPSAYVPVSREEGDYEPVVHKRRHVHAGPAVSSKSVCVRLCDGYFFPAPTAAGGEAACSAECPDAPTALYSMPDEKIEDAYSTTGQKYTALPVAKRYQMSLDSTCTCHRDGVEANAAKAVLHDSTLRKGDVVMTTDGFRVYQGSGPGHDFVALSKASGVPNDERAALAAMERASAGSPAPSAPSQVVTRPHGNVTVDDGTPPPLK